jgi:septal ring factor EnvC (AmiA/AmiB activator)
MLRSLWSLTWVVLAIILGFLDNTKATETVESVTKKLESVRSQVQALQDQLTARRGRAELFQKRLAEIEINIGKVSESLFETSKQSRDLQSTLKSLHSHRQTLQQALRLERNALAQQIRVAYETGRQEKLKLLLNQEDPTSVGRNLVYYDYLNKSRTNKISLVKEKLDSLQNLEQEITGKSITLKRLRQDLVKQKRDLETARERRKNVLIAIKQTIDKNQKRLDALLIDERDLQQLLKSLQDIFRDLPQDHRRGFFKSSKGKLGWPTEGRIKKWFGKIRQNTDGNLKWQGVVIEAQAGEAVYAIASGRVAFADWMRGYGLLLIIDHGGGYMSLYGYNQSLYKSIGDWIDAGDLIARTGDSGGQETPGLYFEIRHEGKPLDPTAWCASEAKRFEVLTRSALE